MIIAQQVLQDLLVGARINIATPCELLVLQILQDAINFSRLHLIIIPIIDTQVCWTGRITQHVCLHSLILGIFQKLNRRVYLLPLAQMLLHHVA